MVRKIEMGEREFGVVDLGIDNDKGIDRIDRGMEEWEIIKELK